VPAFGRNRAYSPLPKPPPSGGGFDTTLALVESHHGIYDGVIAVAPEAAGWPNCADFLLRYGLAYAAAFGWPTDWWGPIEDVRDDLSENVCALVAPVFQWAGPHNYAQWEFIRLVMKLPPAAWWRWNTGWTPGSNQMPPSFRLARDSTTPSCHRRGSTSA
jgi:hypothetical protein